MAVFGSTSAIFSAALYFFYLINGCSSFIIPNEIPTLLSIIYSNIPPVKVGFDTRFGLGFRLGPHADYQTLIEIGPQTNTNPISSNGTVSKRQSNTLKILHRLYELPKNAGKNSPQKEPSSKGKKVEKTVVGKIEFKKVPGIDEVGEKTKSVKNEKTTQGSSPTKFPLL